MIRNEGLPRSWRWTQSRGGQRGVTLERPKHEKDKSLQGALQPLPQRSAVCCARCQDQRWGATVRSHPLLGPDSFKQGILFNLPVNYVVPIVAHLLPGLPYKVPQTAWLQTTEMYRLVVWRPEVRHQGACKLVPSEAAREGLSQVPPPPRFLGFAGILAVPWLEEASLSSPSPGVLPVCLCIQICPLQGHHTHRHPHLNLFVCKDPISK